MKVITNVPKNKHKKTEHRMNFQRSEAAAWSRKLGILVSFITLPGGFIISYSFSVYKMKVMLPSSEGSYAG